MKFPRARRALVGVSVCVAAAVPATVASAEGITGISDDGIGTWTQAVQSKAESVGPRFAHARRNVYYGVATLPAGHQTRVDFQQWYDRVTAMGKRPMVSFKQLGWGEDEDRPTVAAYTSAVSAFVSAYPLVRDFSAWNEPNNGVFNVPAAQAVSYLGALTSVVAQRCGSDCRVVAGDFAGDSTPGTYFDDYRRAVVAAGLNPTVWGYHPYEVINLNASGSVSYTGLNTFLQHAGSEVWFTEVGAYTCFQGRPYSLSEQQVAARRLAILMDQYAARVKRTYYYQFRGWQTDANCIANGQHDSGLIWSDQNGTSERPAFGELYPAVKRWQLRNDNSFGPVNLTTMFGTGQLVTGDWDGNGTDTPASFDGGAWTHRNLSFPGPSLALFHFGATGHVPLAGDWDGDGKDSIGVYDPASQMFWLKNGNNSGTHDYAVNYGFPGGIPLVGDWNGDGRDTVGMWNPGNSRFYLRNSLTNGPGEIEFEFGWSAGIPLVGDWNRDGVDTIGMFNRANGWWYLKNQNTFGGNDYAFEYGASIHDPIVGDWDGNGTDTPGVTSW